MSNGPIEIINGRERRRRWSLEEKRRIVAESYEPGASVRAVAARHDVYPNLLSTWRGQMRRGRLMLAPPAHFVPIHVVETGPLAATTPPSELGRPTTDTIEIILPDGSRICVGNAVSVAALRRVMTVLRG